MLDFTAKADWFSGSPDLNPLDCSQRSKFEEVAFRRHLTTLMASTANETVRAMIDEWPKRLKKLRVKSIGTTSNNKYIPLLTRLLCTFYHNFRFVPLTVLL